MNCREIMTPNLEFCLPEDSMQKVALTMKNHSVGSIPVIESHESKRLVGIITDRDITLRVVAEGLDAKNTRVADVMTRKTESYDLLTCREEDDVEKALALMEQLQVRRIPVLNGIEQVVGIIAQADVMTRLHNSSKSAEVVEKISQPIATSAGR
jgi:CBS domain-containing protein